MGRASDGTYSLAPGNPVVTLTTITSTWANNTMSDLASAMTDSLSRSGSGGMLAQFKAYDGTAGAPGISWAAETTSGIYRAAAQDFRWMVAGVEMLKLTASGLTATIAAITGTQPMTTGPAITLSSAFPGMAWIETDAAADNKRWEFAANSEQFFGRVVDDANSVSANWILVDRTGVAVDSVTFPAQTVFTKARLASFEYGLLLKSANPFLGLEETDASADNKKWYILAGTEAFSFGVLNDIENAATSWLVVERSGLTIDSVTFSPPTYFTQVANAIIGTISLQASVPGIQFKQTLGTANNKVWLNYATGSGVDFAHSVWSDDGSASTSWMNVTRSGATIVNVNICPTAGLALYAGYEIGFRNLIDLTFTTDGTLADVHRGKMLRYLGGGGHTLTCPTTFAGSEIFTILNNGAAFLTLAAAGGATLYWVNGSGAFATGPRGLAVAGVCTVWYISASTILVWGIGIS